jgi:TolB protein
MITQAETQKSTQVMSWQGTVCDLLWLPQTSQIAFAGTIHSSCAFPIDDMQHGTVDQHPEQQVYRINPDGTELTQLSHTAGGAYDISLSPDGRMLGYVNANRRGTQSLYVFDLKDGVERSTKIAGMSYGVDWSPDSRWLFAVSEVIVKSDPVTFEEEELLIGVGGYTMGGWAPDGKRVFVRGYCCGVEFIFYIDITEPDTTHEFDQIEELHTPYNPVWSPDGEWIAYDAFPGCRFACP